MHSSCSDQYTYGVLAHRCSRSYYRRSNPGLEAGGDSWQAENRWAKYVEVGSTYIHPGLLTQPEVSCHHLVDQYPKTRSTGVSLSVASALSHASVVPRDRDGTRAGVCYGRDAGRTSCQVAPARQFRQGEPPPLQPPFPPPGAPFHISGCSNNTKITHPKA